MTVLIKKEDSRPAGFATGIVEEAEYKANEFFALSFVFIVLGIHFHLVLVDQGRLNYKYSSIELVYLILER